MKSSTDYFVLGTDLGAVDSVRKQRDKSPCPHRVYILGEAGG